MKPLVLAALFGSSYAYAGSYALDVVTIPGAQKTLVFGVNDNTDLTGVYFDSNGKEHAFLRRNGVVTAFDFPNAEETRPLGINNAGTVVGRYSSALRWHAFVYQQGRFQTVDLPGSTSDAAVDINDQGEILLAAEGMSTGSEFLVNANDVTPITSATPALSFNGLNNRGALVGASAMYIQDSSGGVILNAGQLIKDIVPADTIINTSFDGINDNGLIVGTADNVPFVYQAGHFQFLRLFNGAEAFGAGINNAGQIAGSFSEGDPFDPHSKIFGYVATPLPEPTVSVLIAGIGVILLVRRRRDP